VVAPSWVSWPCRSWRRSCTVVVPAVLGMRRCLSMSSLALRPMAWMRFGGRKGREHRSDGVGVHGVAVVDGDGVGSCEQVVGGGDEERVAQDQVCDEPFGFGLSWWREVGQIEERCGGEEVVVGGDETVRVHLAPGRLVASLRSWPAAQGVRGKPRDSRRRQENLVDAGVRRAARWQRRLRRRRTIRRQVGAPWRRRGTRHPRRVWRCRGRSRRRTPRAPRRDDPAGRRC
jgi:hypothetical protein